MLLKASRILAVALLAMSWTVPAEAEVVGEGVTALRCAEGADVAMPRKMELLQAVLSDAFAEHGQAVLILEAEYAEAADVNRGKVQATVYLTKDGGDEVKLAKLSAKMRDGEAFDDKVVAAKLERGDLLRWKVKLKKLPKVLAELEDCLNFYFVVAVGDEPLG